MYLFRFGVPIYFASLIFIYSRADEFTCEFRTPGAGIEVSSYKLEAQCAMECYQQNNCSKYLYNELDKKCTLMTPYDFNFLGEELIDTPENYQLKVCVSSAQLSTGSSENYNNNVHFLPVKELEQSVESWASSLGFDKRIEFTDLNIAKFYKVIDQPEEPFWYHYRICAQHGGITPVVYNKEMADTVLAELSPDDTHLYSRIAIRHNPSDGSFGGKMMNGFELVAGTQDDLEACESWLEIPEVTTTTTTTTTEGFLDELLGDDELPPGGDEDQPQGYPAMDFLYDKDVGKFVFDTNMELELKTSKIICEYPGGINLVAPPAMPEGNGGTSEGPPAGAGGNGGAGSGTDGSGSSTSGARAKATDSMYLEQIPPNGVIDNDWSINSHFDNNRWSTWYGSGANSILAVEFGYEILLKMVLILPCTEEYCMKTNQLRVTVGYALPEMSTGNIDMTKFVACGKHPYEESNESRHQGDIHAINCGKCLVMGTIAVIDNLIGNNPPEINEIAFFGVPKKDILN